MPKLKITSTFRTRLLQVIVILAVAGIGTYLLVGSHAATPSVAVNADTGTVANGATKQACSGASDTNCVLFQSASTGGSPTQANCITANGSNAPIVSCGYPNAGGNDGAGDCSALTKFSFSNIPDGTYYSGSGNTLEIIDNNVTISNMNMGNVSIYVSDVNNLTLNHDCFNIVGDGTEYSIGINIPSGVTGTTIENSTISGTNATNQSLGSLIDNNGSGTVIKSNYMYNAGGDGPGSGDGSALVQDNFEWVNGSETGDGSDGVNHYEAIADDGGGDGGSTLTATHNTLINPHEQTAAIFTQCTTGGPINLVDIENNLLAGGGYTLYGPLSDTCPGGLGPEKVINNRFSKLYFADSGQYGQSIDFPNNVTWSGNYWDNDLSPITTFN